MCSNCLPVSAHVYPLSTHYKLLPLDAESKIPVPFSLLVIFACFCSRFRETVAAAADPVSLTPAYLQIREKTERSMPMYSQRRIESTSDYSFAETDPGTKSRPRSRLTGCE